MKMGDISFKDTLKLYDERLRIRVENELNLTFTILVKFSNKEDEEMVQLFRNTLRTEIDFCRCVGLITTSEWNFLKMASDII